MARADFLRGKQASAAKFYLDELKSETSNIRRERLLNSLLAIEPRSEELDEYFDTPTHALFIANRITDDDAYNALAAGLIARLGQHTELFRQGADSDALTIAMMRASTRLGAPEATLGTPQEFRPARPAIPRNTTGCSAPPVSSRRTTPGPSPRSCA